MPTKGLGIGALGFGQLGGATPPGGNIKAIPYVSKWVQFAANTSLREAISGIADCSNFALSMWIDIAAMPTVSGADARNGYFGLSLLQFGRSVFVGGGILPGDYIWTNSLTLTDIGGGQIELDAVLASGYRSDGTGSNIQPVLLNRTNSFSFPVNSKVHVFISGQVDPAPINVGGGYLQYFNSPLYMLVNGVRQAPVLPVNPGASGNETYSLLYENPGNGSVSRYGNNQEDSVFLPPAPVFALNGLQIGIPSIAATDLQPNGGGYSGAGNAIIRYSDVQMWFGKYIDPTATYGGALQAKPTQANSQYGQVNPVLVGEVVQAAVAAGLDPLYTLTAMNIESAYGTQPGTVIFELNASHVTDALGSGFSGQSGDNNNQMRAFVASNIAYANAAIPSYMEVAIEFVGTDPTGIYSYLGQLGSANQTNALSALTSQGGLSPATQIKNMPAPSNTQLLGQAWSNPQSGITANSTMAQWFSSLNTVWATASADAASRLQGSNNANINAFINANGGPVPTIVAASLFGEPTVLFTGNATNFPVNVGATQQTEVFTLFQGPLTNF